MFDFVRRPWWSDLCSETPWIGPWIGPRTSSGEPLHGFDYFHLGNQILIKLVCHYNWQGNAQLSPVLTSDASISISIGIRSLCASEDDRNISASIYACVECIFVSIPSHPNTHSTWWTKKIICCFFHLLSLYAVVNAGADYKSDIT